MALTAAIQMCSTAQVDDNLNTAARLIAQAAANQAELIVLPEMFPVIGHHRNDKLAVKEPYGSGPIQEFLSNQAKRNNVWIVGGTIPITSDDPHRINAACLVYDSDGNIRARYDKIHLFDAVVEGRHFKESSTTSPGRQLVTLDSPVGRLGLAVCYDLRFPAMFNALFNEGAEVLAVPTAFAALTGAYHWELLARSRALDNFCYLIGACQAGKHNETRETYGQSMIINPWGQIDLEAPREGEAILYGSIDLEYLYQTRNAIPIHKHHRIKPDSSDLS